MKLEEQIENDICILKLYDRIDASSCKEIKEKVLSLLDRNFTKLLLDMSNVLFIDSSGLGTLITCLKRTKKVGGQLKIAGVFDSVKSVFDTTRMDRIFEVFETTEIAIRSFKLGSHG